ncbi:unnamed protein product [Moneuplotes crassus]|uniref:ADP-ribosylglycohydrolase n=2 Tax=Euplotes crassus TaxID=5936 RepID=A0AAD1UK56_EUPCR|nr:unnamed protein product [Moneuplotes crassus]
MENLGRGQIPLDSIEAVGPSGLLTTPKTGPLSKAELEEMKEEIKHEETKETMKNTKFDKAKGAVIGALCGDAIGAFLEFYGSKITDKVAKQALSMPGKGPHNVGKGQITDDGELTMCLLHALAKGEGKLNNKEIARFYAKWIKSKPFDIGTTCRRSLFKADIKNPNPTRIKEEAAKSDRSQSNGSLMRATPLAVFCHRMKVPNTEDEEEADWSEHRDLVFEAAKQDATFTHLNENVLQIEGLYVYMLTLIINEVPLKQVQEIITTEIEESKNEEFQEWLKESQEDKLGSLKKQMGWMKHAFICCLRYLRLATTATTLDSTFYEASMKEILKGSGDTDTNACIAGGLLGAIVGFHNLPELPRKKVLAWEYKGGKGIKREKFLTPKHYAESLIQKLYDCAPEDLEIVD